MNSRLANSQAKRPSGLSLIRSFLVASVAHDSHGFFHGERVQGIDEEDVVRTYPPGRICRGKNCSVTLSIYNGDKLCSSCIHLVPLEKRANGFGDYVAIEADYRPMYGPLQPKEHPFPVDDALAILAKNPFDLGLI